MNDESDHVDLNDASGAPLAQDGEYGDEAVVAESKAPVNRGTLVMFAIMILAAGALYVMYKRTSPAPASAAVKSASAEANKTISKFLSGGDKSIKSMEQLLKNTEKVVQQFLNYPSLTQVPLGDLRTNPFKQFVESPKTAADAGPSQDTLDKKRREEHRLAVLKAVQGLQLQSIMFSESRRACMINNSLYREGQSIDNFSVEKISPASVVVKNGPYRFELRMQR
jgi:hypothetical protein